MADKWLAGYRAPTTDLPLPRYVLEALRRVQAQVGVEPFGEPSAEAPQSAQARLDELRHLAEQMQVAERYAVAQGLAVPERAGPAAVKFIEFAELALTEKRQSGRR